MQVRPAQVRANETRAAKTSPAEIGAAEIRVAEVGVPRLCLAQVGTSQIRIEEICAHQKAAATINRELAILKRAFTLAIRAGKLLPAHRPYIAMLQEHKVRTGFFEADQFEAGKAHLSPARSRCRRGPRVG